VAFISAKGEFSHHWVAYIGAKADGDPPSTHNWKRLGAATAIPAGTQQIVLSLQDYGPGQVWLDDVSACYLTKAPKEEFEP
jgi:RNA polymerase sigma-70 factor (ECF subfamily)